MLITLLRLIALGVGVLAVLEARAGEARLNCTVFPSGPKFEATAVPELDFERLAERRDVVHVRLANPNGSGRPVHFFVPLKDGRAQIRPGIYDQQFTINCAEK